MYTYTSRIRYSELDQSGRLSLFSLINYFQDCSTFHSEDIGLGIQYLIDQGLVWVMSAWQIVVERFPVLGEDVVIGTSPYGFGSVLGYRNFLLTTAAGEQLACANSIYTLLDLAKGRPTRPTPEMHSGYVLSEKLPMDYADRKISVPAGGLLLAPIEVKPFHLDTNMHVNNGQYINIAVSLLAEQQADDKKSMGNIRQMRAEYKKAAVLGDIMHPSLIMTDNAEIISLCDAAGAPYCIVEIKRRLSDA